MKPAAAARAAGVGVERRLRPGGGGRSAEPAVPAAAPAAAAAATGPARPTRATRSAIDGRPAAAGAGARQPATAALLAQVRACTQCAAQLPHGPRPVLQFDARARILLAAQAPGRKVHASGVPFDDASGERLRAWLGLTRAAFYDPRLLAIVPMGLCYPGKGASGDLPPRRECAPRWRAPLLGRLRQLQLTLVVGQYALAYHLPAERSGLTVAVRGWRRHWPQVVPLPHPSPRNNGWLRANPWFERELLPRLRERVAQIVADRAPRT